MRWLAVAALLLAMPAAAARGADRYVPIPISMANDGSGSEVATNFVGAATDGSVVYFSTQAQLLPEDGDS